MTKKEMFVAIRATLSDGKPATSEMFEFIDHQIELLSRKSSGTSTKSKVKQAEHDELKSRIEDVLSTSGALSITEIVKTLNTNGLGVSSQKINSMVKQLKDEGRVVRTVEGKKAFFSLPDTDEEEGV